MQRQLIICVLALAFAGSLCAQPIRSNSKEQKLKAAQEAESAANYAGALEWYEEAYEDTRKAGGRSGGEEANLYRLKIAELSYEIRDYEKAEKNYRRVIEKDKEGNYIDAIFMHGKSLKALGQYDIAINAFSAFINKSDDQEMIAAAKNELAGIKLVEELEPNIETSFRMLDKNINSGSGEFSPRQNPGDGNLYYASMNTNKIIDASDNAVVAQIMVAPIGKDGKLGKAEKLDKTINREEFHSANVAFSEDGRTMYFTRVKTEGTEITASEILYSQKTDAGWSAPDKVTGLNGEWHSKNPALGTLYGRKVIFFSSDMPGGSGGMDIYYANVLGDGEFSTPVNLGETINTVNDDLSPFFHEGTLYYSTDGRPTIGGYDIFYTVWDGTAWSRTENLGLGFNSSYDDLYFSMNSDGKSGYIVSNRPSENKKRLKSKTCCDDIYAFEVQELVIDLLAIVVDESEGALNGATIKLKNLTDPVSNPTDSKYNALGNEFQFLLGSDYKYKAFITADGYYPDSIEFNTAGYLDNGTVNKTIKLKPLPKEPEVTTETTTVTINEPIRLSKIYYDLDDDKILPESEPDLYKLFDLLNKYPDMVIELSSHTDSQGRSSYNEDLSQRRAESATRWLLDKGVSKKRIKPVGYGENVIINHCKNGVKCSDEEHRQNRRTEFKIIAGPQTIEITKEVITPIGG
jgi:peptidoglycan-associated lipoprotein